MTVLVNIIVPVLTGLTLGIMYFGGLWLTLSRVTTSSQPALLVLGSYMGRLAICLGGFVLVARIAELQGLLLCSAAFIGVRIFLVRRWGKPRLAFPGTEAGR